MGNILRLKTDFSTGNNGYTLISHAIENHKNTDWSSIDPRWALNERQALEIMVINLLLTFERHAVLAVFKNRKMLTIIKPILKKAG